MAERRALRLDDSYAVACPNCHARLFVSNRHIFSECPPYPAIPREMVLTEDGEVVHRCALGRP